MSSTWDIKQWRLQDRLRLGQPPQPSEEHHEEGYRRVICNDPQANLQFKYQGNSVSTTKFNLFTFLPKGLFEQFRRLANLYFLVIAILSLAPISPIQPITNILPLVLVLCISLSKEAFEDWRRFRNDKRINSSLVEVLHGDSWTNITWSKLVVGNLVRIKSNEYFPADLVLLSTSNDEGICYIETSNLDGESNLKTRRALEQTWKYGNANEASKFTGEIHCEHPNDSLYSFTGNLIIGKETYPISVENVLLRGCSLKNTSWTVGIVIFAGHETKVMKNALNVPSKRSRLEKKIDKVIYCLFGILFTIALIGGIGCAVGFSSIIIYGTYDLTKIQDTSLVQAPQYWWTCS